MIAVHSTIMIRQILDFNKKMFDDSLNVMIAAQEHSEKMMGVFRLNSAWIPEEGKKVFGDWGVAYKSGLDAFKADTDSRFKLVEKYLINAADQMEASLNRAAKQTEDVLPAVGRIKEKVAADIKKAASRKPSVSKVKISRKRTNKQK